MNAIESTVSDWSGIEVEPHRFSAREFTLDGTEIGHLHSGRLLDIPFPKRIRDILIEEGRAEKHHIHPESGWVSYSVDGDEAIEDALWLLRVSYLYHLIGMQQREERSAEPIDIDTELAELNISSELHDVFDEANG